MGISAYRCLGPDTVPIISDYSPRLIADIPADWHTNKVYSIKGCGYYCFYRITSMETGTEHWRECYSWSDDPRMYGYVHKGIVPSCGAAYINYQSFWDGDGAGYTYGQSAQDEVIDNGSLTWVANGVLSVIDSNVDIKDENGMVIYDHMRNLTKVNFNRIRNMRHKVTEGLDKSHSAVVVYGKMVAGGGSILGYMPAEYNYTVGNIPNGVTGMWLAAAYNPVDANKRWKIELTNTEIIMYIYGQPGKPAGGITGWFKIASVLYDHVDKIAVGKTFTYEGLGVLNGIHTYTADLDGIRITFTVINQELISPVHYSIITNNYLKVESIPPRRINL